MPIRASLPDINAALVFTMSPMRISVPTQSISAFLICIRFPLFPFTKVFAEAFFKKPESFCLAFFKKRARLRVRNPQNTAVSFLQAFFFAAATTKEKSDCVSR
jgi:hypothetical protein